MKNKERQHLYRGKRMLGIACGLSLFVLAGCRETDEIVVLRGSEEQGAEKIQENAGGIREQVQAPKAREAELSDDEDREQVQAPGSWETGSLDNGIREQVQAPGSWETEFSDGGITVKVNAKVTVPDAEGFRMQKVAGRTFSEEEYEAANKVLLQGEGDWLYTKKRRETEETQEWTKEEIEEQIAALEEKIASKEKGKTMLGGQALTYEEAVRMWRKRLEAAPDMFETEVFSYEEVINGGQNGGGWEGYGKAGEEEYLIVLQNDPDWDPKWVDISFEIFADEFCAGYRDHLNMEEQKKLEESFHAAMPDVISEAEALVKELGLDEYRVFGGEFVDMGIRNTPQEVIPGYIVHFTRAVDGISVNYGNDLRGWFPEAEIHWEEERLDVLYGEEGFAGLVWKNPYEVKEEGEGWVKLLSFEEIQDIFRKMMPLKYEELKGREEQGAEFTITEVRLGYQRSREERGRAEATLIPVWDFYGTRTLTGDLYDIKQPYYRWLTINAVDGTVIER